ncbi:MAG: nitroreductase [Lysobacterales bacterium CG02_land_8_20_14_3_00_62_12]|nr:MAG: nitroreductase [Xanthomonadales bacterium CG02_land_8_20_14_3_00_62_12]
MKNLDFLTQRQSVPSKWLTAPGPNPAQLSQLLQAALRVPDHGLLQPFRLLTISGDARKQLGNLLAERWQQLHPDAGGAALDKERGRFAQAPLIVTVIGCVQSTERIPAQEQLLSAGCVGYNLLLGAQALGFGAQWLTGWAAYDPVIATRLGLQAAETVLGFIHIGSAPAPAPERPRPLLAEKVSVWEAPPR